MVNSTLDMKIITYAQCPILLYETLRVACFHEVVRQGSVTTPTTTLLRRRSVPFGKLRAGKVSTSAQCPIFQLCSVPNRFLQHTAP